MKRYKKNLRIIGNNVISYQTKVAVINREKQELIVLKGVRGSMTTTTHINYVAKELGLKKVEEIKLVLRANPKKNHSLGFMKMFLALGDLTKGEQTREQKLAYDEKIVFSTMRSLIPDWEKPNDWDSLSIEQKEQRIVKLKTVI